MQRKLPPSFYNLTTLAGGIIAGVSFGLIIFLLALEQFSANPKPYMGIIAFVILPAFLLGGLALGALGVWREHRRRKLGDGVEHHLPVVDLNNPRHQTAVGLVATGSLLLIVFSGFGSFQAYEHTDSDSFCGQTCHTVMNPEYTAYSNSPHAKVGCVKCHIGPGAGWFVRSKLSGSYQLYSVAFNKYPRPIATPVHNLRPAKETCGNCHWPSQFFSEKRMSNTYFASDPANSKWTLDLLVRIGGGNSQAGPTSGIHWHMNINNKVSYLATDDARQVIPWVRAVGPDGKATVYQSTELPPVKVADVQENKLRTMDCIDCHNRPTHIFYPAARSVDNLMAVGRIDPSLPSAKNLVVYALEKPYATNEAAADSIKSIITGYYDTAYPDVATAKKADIARMVSEAQGVYARNYFPAMKANWKAFPDNIGHMYFLGCFRCHDGKHVSETGKVLTNDCNACHVVLAQQTHPDSTRVSLKGIEFRHPVDIGDAWKKQLCSDCHNPAPGAKPLVKPVVGTK
ncbi:MAG: NapC/NirT family cytochrome c [Gemmatimonadetes bacterium]|nr:NapC/NirT family cytochrome c [Gemmatimonadota bacterium]